MKKSTIKDLRSECACEHLEYCPLEALVKTASDRLAEQHKLVEYFKFTKHLKTWEDAYSLWISEKYAERFAEVYSPDKSYRQLRDELFSNNR
jgi:hypothetical protein